MDNYEEIIRRVNEHEERSFAMEERLNLMEGRFFNNPGATLATVASLRLTRVGQRRTRARHMRDEIFTGHPSHDLRGHISLGPEGDVGVAVDARRSTGRYLAPPLTEVAVRWYRSNGAPLIFCNDSWFEISLLEDSQHWGVVWGNARTTSATLTENGWNFGEALNVSILVRFN